MTPLRSPVAPMPSTVWIDQSRKAALTEALPEMPGVLSDLITEYDASMANVPLERDRDGRVKISPDNYVISLSIAEALTSAQADPNIKRKIFANAIAFGYNLELNLIMEAIRARGQKINLDHTDLGGFALNPTELHDVERKLVRHGAQFLTALTNFKLSGVSALQMDLSHSSLLNLNLTGADLSGANFTDTTLVRCCLINANLSGALFERTNFVMCSVQGVITNDGALKSKVWVSANGVGLKLHGVHTSRKESLLDENITLIPSRPAFAGSDCIIS